MKARCFKVISLKSIFSHNSFLTNPFDNALIPKCTRVCCRLISTPRSSRSMCSSAKQEKTVMSEIKLPSFKDFTSLIENSQAEKKIKIILMEHALARMSCGNVPAYLSVADMDELLQCKTACERMDLFDLFYIKETRKEFLKLKNIIEGGSQWEKDRIFLINSYEASDHIRYGYNHNCIHIYFEPEWFRSYYNFRLAQAAKFGQPLVFDFGFEQYMTKRECLSTAMYLQEVYIENRRSNEPFDIHFSNYNQTHSDHILFSEVNRLVKHSSGAHSMVTTSEKKYLDLFPNKECVYLTSHADEDLEYFDHDVVYIIGAFLDSVSSKPLPFHRAKQDGVRTLRIPVEKYQKFYANPHKAHRFLTYIQILFEMKKSSSWRDVVKKSLTSPKNDFRDERFARTANRTNKRFKFIMKNYW